MSVGQESALRLRHSVIQQGANVTPTVWEAGCVTTTLYGKVHLWEHHDYGDSTLILEFSMLPLG